MDVVVDAAIRLIEEDGVHALSMQSLAKRLGTGSATLYNYVGSRDELIDLVLGRALSDLPAIPRFTREDWPEQLVDYLVANFREGIARPAVLQLWHQRPSIHVGAATRTQQELGLLESLGFTPERAAEVFRILATQLVGHIGIAAALAQRPATAVAEDGTRLRAAQEHLDRLGEERIYESAVRGLVASFVREVEGDRVGSE